MVYITYNVPERFRQITFEELMSDKEIPLDFLRTGGRGSTRTVVCDRVPNRIMKITDIPMMIRQLQNFNETYQELLNHTPRSDLYDHFEIPKKSGGGMRPIDAPKPELKKALAILKAMLSGWMFADHHTCAFAYVNERSTVDAAKKHQRFGGWYFAHYDFHGFFPSTTLGFLVSQMQVVYPFNLILANPAGAPALRTALSLCFLNGGLPQGTPISPVLTNIMMIPFDHRFARLLNKYESGKCNASGTPITDRICYTRYADDIHLSCHVIFNYHKVERDMISLLQDLGAPFTLNTSKTHFGTRAGRNWILGVMLNKNNDITVGYRKHKIFKAQINSYLNDKRKGVKWNEEDLQRFRGTVSYYHMIEPETVDYIIQKYNTKYNADFMALLQDDLTPHET